MVQILIDGKEYNGRKVIIPNQVGKIESNIDFNKSEVTIKDKQEFVSVPRDIGFVSFFENPLHHSLMLKFGDHYLRHTGGTWAFVPISSFNPELVRPIKCVLVPCKRKDLTEGSWAFWELADQKSGLSTDNIEQYTLITSEDTHIYILDPKYVLKTGIHEENEVDTCIDIKWFKIIPEGVIY